MKKALEMIRAARVATMKSEAFDAEMNLGIAELALTKNDYAMAIKYARKSLRAAKT